MSKREILGQAIDKALAGGWKAPQLAGGEGDGNELWSELTELEKAHFLRIFTTEGTGDAYKIIIFNHEFAKALWSGPGDFPYLYDVDERLGDRDPWQRSSQLYRWQYHLQQMVIAEDPIKYLGENLPKDGDAKN